MIRKLIQGLIILATTSPVFATNAIYKDIAFQDPALTTLQQTLLQQLRDEELIGAGETANDMVELVSRDFDVDSLNYAKVLTNSALIDWKLDRPEPALASLRLAIAHTESISPFHSALFEMLIAEAVIEHKTGYLEYAADTYRQAQHISHRIDGVYTQLQIPVIDALTEIHIRTNKPYQADQEQRLKLKVIEQAFGPDDEAIIPTLTKLGAYFAVRGHSFNVNVNSQTRLYRDSLFRDAINMFDRSLAILEDNYGEADLRLVDPLIEMSKVRFLQGSSRTQAEEAMQRAYAIVSNHPSSDAADVANALVKLADTYTLTSDTRNVPTYEAAWALLADTPENEQLRYQLFSIPKRLYPDKTLQPVLARQPVTVPFGEELFVELEYSVNPTGRVSEAKIIDSNVPNEQRKLYRSYISTLKYRPRMAEGSPVKTQGLGLRQTYKVLQSAPSLSETVPPGED
jgi:tetratricopeptide (TPR) repeat protein